MAESEHVVVFVTAPRDAAPGLARALVESQVAACTNVIDGVRSIYRWKGELCDDEEALLVIKTRRARFDALQERIVALHPYEVPEIIAQPIVDGHAPYLAWIDENT